MEEEAAKGRVSATQQQNRKGDIATGQMIVE